MHICARPHCHGDGSGAPRGSAPLKREIYFPVGEKHTHIHTHTHTHTRTHTHTTHTHTRERAWLQNWRPGCEAARNPEIRSAAVGERGGLHRHTHMPAPTC